MTKCKNQAFPAGVKDRSPTTEGFEEEEGDTRIEITCDTPQKEFFHGPASPPRTRRPHVVDSAGDIAEGRLAVQAPETIRVRDLDMRDVQMFTPIAAPMTQATQPLSAQSLEARRERREDWEDGDDYVPLPDVYDVEKCSCATDGCETLSPEEICCSRRLLGQGASSQVYKGLYRDEQVVLKFIMGSKEDSFEKEFRRECLIFQKIPPHENIIKLHGVVGTCLVLEYCDLGSLFDCIHDPTYELPLWKVCHRLKDAEATDWMPQVKEMLLDIASSLQHLHSRKMIHRDLKPGNLLIKRVGTREVVKLADFGLARNYLKNATMTVGIGTWQYSSPEFFANSKLTAKSDVYSFGLVMWELCAREQPYKDRHFREIYERILKGQDYRLAPPEKMDPALKSLYFDCTALDPDDRPNFATIVSHLTPPCDSGDFVG